MKQETKKEMKRKAILKSAAKSFENRRFDEVTLDEIATGASVGKGTLYLYFSNKEDLFLQLAIEGIDEMVLRIQKSTDQKNELFEKRFQVLARELASFFMHRSGFIRLLHQAMSDEIHEGFRQHRQRMHEAVTAFLSQGVKEGALRNDCSLLELELLVVGPLIMRSRIAEGNNITAPENLIQIIWSGIKRP